MCTNAVGFEYEILSDNSLRLRFLNCDEGIIGQHVVSAKATLPLQLIVGLAVAKTKHFGPKTLLKAWHQAGLDIDSAFVGTLIDAVRVRAILTPEGGLKLDAFKRDES